MIEEAISRKLSRSFSQFYRPAWAGIAGDAVFVAEASEVFGIDGDFLRSQMPDKFACAIPRLGVVQHVMQNRHAPPSTITEARACDLSDWTIPKLLNNRRELLDQIGAILSKTLRQKFSTHEAERGARGNLCGCIAPREREQERSEINVARLITPDELDDLRASEAAMLANFNCVCLLASDLAQTRLIGIRQPAENLAARMGVVRDMHFFIQTGIETATRS